MLARYKTQMDQQRTETSRERAFKQTVSAKEGQVSFTAATGNGSATGQKMFGNTISATIDLKATAR